MGDEVHVVTRQETFNDLAVRELAKSRAACLCRIQFKRCKLSKCSACSTYKHIENCKSCMNDFDVERLNHYTSVYYTEYSINPMNWMSHTEYKRYFRRYIVACILFILLLFCVPAVLVGPFDRPVNQIDYDAAIIRTVQVAQSQVYDLDKDGLVNCIDYAIMFKLVWDRNYPRLKGRCTIIRNVNWLTSMNHLFIYVMTDEGRNIAVEPGTYDPYIFRMEDVWGDRYDSICNNYGETDYWLSEVK